MLKFELYNKKIQQSTINHKKALENKAKQIMKHNTKVDMVKDSILRTIQNNDNEIIIDYLNKHQNAISRREKRQNEFDTNLERKKKFLLDKRIRLEMSKIDDQQKYSKKEEELERKHFKSLEVLKRNKQS